MLLLQVLPELLYICCNLCSHVQVLPMAWQAALGDVHGLKKVAEFGTFASCMYSLPQLLIRVPALFGGCTWHWHQATSFTN